MAGHSSREIRVSIDQSALERLADFGEIAVGYPGAEVDAVRIVYNEEDLERDMAEPGA